MKIKILFLILLLFSFVCSHNNDPDPEPPPPPSIPTVAQDIQLPTIVSTIGYPIYLQTAFMPEYLVAHKVKDADLEAFLDEFCRQEAGNSIRVFLWVNWKWKHTQWMYQPFLKNAQGKYDVTGDIVEKINPEYLDIILRRIKMFAERKIFLSIDLIDNCSCHWSPAMSWGNNFLNGDVNNANTGKSPSDIYDWDDTSEKAQNTHMLYERFIKFIIREIRARFSVEELKFIGLNAGNEIDPHLSFHVNMTRIINEATGISFPKWKKISSALPQSGITAQMMQGWIYQAHKVGDMDAYNERVPIPAIKWMISTDGYKKDGEKVLISKAMAIQLTHKMLKDGGRGIELMQMHRKNDIREPHPGSPYYTFEGIAQWQVMKAVVEQYRMWRDN